ncbi:hypothetical protein CYMTET_8921 [Cymbomonas tetramitiformis]|uniref:HNH nuclease domain-containing protein n=1 Tax=Cymbomonas tetramitiformis TaxID=36881 RepID=A0AAE0LFD4_9CHLO|nr:hypothetical protein CYMTET_8921 [Cymbomonas tetramitiformis]
MVAHLRSRGLDKSRCQAVLDERKRASTLKEVRNERSTRRSTVLSSVLEKHVEEADELLCQLKQDPKRGKQILETSGVSLDKRERRLLRRKLRGLRNKRHSVAPRTRRHVFSRDGLKCFYCGKVSTPDGVTLDHIVPLSQGGSSHRNNLVTACLACNQSKGSLWLEEAIEQDKLTT